jgi:hypothetical protein
MVITSDQCRILYCVIDAIHSTVYNILDILHELYIKSFGTYHIFQVIRLCLGLCPLCHGIVECAVGGTLSNLLSYRIHIWCLLYGISQILCICRKERNTTLVTSKWVNVVVGAG